MSETLKRMLFVVANLGVGALVWPSATVDNDKQQFTWDPKVQTLEWVHCFEYDAFTLIRSKVVSPLHRRVARGEQVGMQACVYN